MIQFVYGDYMGKIKDYLKEEQELNAKFFVKYFILMFFVVLICTYEFPYYIDKPGGLSNLNNKVEIENSYKAKGSFNLTYVSEVKGTLPLMIYAAINPEWDVVAKADSNIGTLNYYSLLQRERIMMIESYNNAIKYAYEKAGKSVKTTNENIFVGYKFDGFDNTLEVGDQIIEVDGIAVNSYEELKDIVSKKKSGEKGKIKVIHSKREYTRDVTYKMDDSVNRVVMGVSISVIPELETNPVYKFDYDKSEFGPSGGLMISLAVYNQLVKEDITGGKTIAGTGTLDSEGKVGSIGGVEYKLKGAVKGKADIFFVPAGENYDDAIALKKKRHYKIEIVKVETFDDALNYLEKNVIKK
jgi:PDZ domain-containing protein